MEDSVRLDRIAQELKVLRELMSGIAFALREAETEVPDKIRRFMMYMHDIHSVSYMYEERGLSVPVHILREMERCDDRLRQLLEEQHNDGGAFEKVRRAMAEDPNNRWDHTRQLTNGVPK